MNVVVHYPESVEEKYALREKVALVHAQAVLHKLQSLSYSKEQGIGMIRELLGGQSFSKVN